MSQQEVDAKNLKPGDKRAWAIVVGLGFLAGAGLQQILANCGNFIPQICADLQCDPGQLTLWITMYAIFMAISQPVVGRLWPKVSPKILVTVAFLVSIIALALMGTYTAVWQFWISGAVIGLSGGSTPLLWRPLAGERLISSSLSYRVLWRCRSRCSCSSLIQRSLACALLAGKKVWKATQRVLPTPRVFPRKRRLRLSRSSCFSLLAASSLSMEASKIFGDSPLRNGATIACSQLR